MDLPCDELCSSQAMAAYATTKVTSVPTIVGPTPMPLPCRFLELEESRRGQRRDREEEAEPGGAASRSKPSSRPAEMVAPERETPGTSAMHWAKPTMSRVGAA